MEQTIISYKGFDMDFKCREFQYELNKEYKEDNAICCRNGFHACENPIDVLDYCDVINSRFAIVEQSGVIDKKDNKTCSSTIKIKSELSLSDFINACVNNRIEKTKLDIACKLNDKGRSYVTIEANGSDNEIISSGYYAKIKSDGYTTNIISAGDNAKITTSSIISKVLSSGNSATIILDAGNSTLLSSGNSAKIVSSNEMNKILSTGDDANIVSIGNYAQIKSEGKNATIVCTGQNNKVKAKIGTLITFNEYDRKGNFLCTKTEQVDGKKIMEDTWYQLVHGVFKIVPIDFYI